MTANTVDLYALVVEDGYLHGASRDDDAGCPYGYWMVNHLGVEQWTLVVLKDVPEDLAARLEDHGTSAQDFSDGYEAWAAAQPYDAGTVEESS